MALDSINKNLFRRNAPIVSLKVGEEFEGTLLDADEIHEREWMKDGSIGDKLYWSPSGKVTKEETDRPKTVVVLLLQTELGKDNADDDGKRRFFLKGRSKDNPGAPYDVFLKAVKDSGAKDLEAGAYVWMKCTHTDGEGRQAPKHYDGKYLPAAENTHATKNMVQANAASSKAKSKKADPFSK